MHVLEGSREEIEGQLRMSIDTFFDFYPEIGQEVRGTALPKPC